VGATSTQYQQNVVTLYNAFQPVSPSSIPANQTSTGQCVSGTTYWDLGVRGDTGPGQHSKAGSLTLQLSPTYSILTNASEAASGTFNTATNPGVTQQYCNGSRVSPEYAAGTFNVPPGISDATVPNPLFTLQTNATVDEGNNWVNLTWGPLSLTNPTVNTGSTGNYGSGPMLGNWTAASGGSSMVDFVPPCAGTAPGGTGTCTTPTNTAYTQAPKTDFLGHARPDPAGKNIDAGAFEFGGVAPAPPSINAVNGIVPSSGYRRQTVSVTINGTNLAGVTSVTAGTGITVGALTTTATTITTTFTIAVNAPLGAHTVTVSANGFSATTTFTVLGTTLTSIAPPSASRGTSTILVPVVLMGVDFTGATAVNITNGTGTAVTVSSFTVVSDTQINATFSVPSSASLGNRNVTVTSPAGTSAARTWTLVAGSLTFSAPNPTLAPTTANTATETGIITVTNTLTGSVTLSTAPGITQVSGPGTFSIVAGGTCGLGTVIAANGGSCTINVQYAAGGNTGAATAYITTNETGAVTTPQYSGLINAN